MEPHIFVVLLFSLPIWVRSTSEHFILKRVIRFYLFLISCTAAVLVLIFITIGPMCARLLSKSWDFRGWRGRTGLCQYQYSSLKQLQTMQVCVTSNIIRATMGAAFPSTHTLSRPSDYGQIIFFTQMDSEAYGMYTLLVWAFTSCRWEWWGGSTWTKVELGDMLLFVAKFPNTGRC